ncbi:MAG TPA: methionyl-tRNA formyltransferase [Chitinophagales bacterium]|jgi:methionyl-tRNA formyltransferase|nr:methionyl-tRNA formyltransferase [Chitinophagales bacterium]HQW78431.1 methionyl-tRNA formyltransferase [Chitinophagales bacterium]HRB19053.1 methionyl-tRNA formyltransferase [Chitinophagales bacterium]HRB67202.1 methionyl-tRNA formyltransferase [Chitinophagales bacterium]HRB69773.1 methionyl-tRNA formyltransferase [Chitinophagales bacterium]
MNNELRIVFMGTPDFAVPSLDILIQHKYNVVGVITAPDKPSGRGQHIQQTAIKNYALEKNLNILQPEKLKNPTFINELEALNANLFIVVAFRMLPEIVWKMPKLGTFNLHASLLPQYRGAAPINWAVINGEIESGVTTFFLQHEIDTGNILFQEKVTIDKNDNAGNLHDKLMHIGANLVLKTVQNIETNNIQSIPQENVNIEHATLHHAPKIFKETCLIDWNKNADAIQNLIRGLAPYPAAFTYLDGKVVKIFNTKITAHFSNPSSNTRNSEVSNINYITDQKSYLAYQCADSYLEILELQLEGKKRMTIQEFLRGYKFK